MDATANTFDFGALARLKSGVTQPASGSGQTAKITQNQAVAQQFEAIFLQMMLKRMREATPREGLFDSDQTRLVQSLADEQLASQLATPGIGLAQGLLRQMAGQGEN